MGWQLSTRNASHSGLFSTVIDNTTGTALWLQASTGFGIGFGFGFLFRFTGSGCCLAAG